MANYNFDGSEGGYVPESTAKQYLQNYQQGPAFNWNHGVKAHFFGKDILQDMLNQQGAMGLRLYYGSKVDPSSNTLQPELVLVAADSNGDDITANNKIADFSRPCPQFCPDNGLTP